MASRQTDPNRGRAGKSFLALESLETRDCPSAVLFQNHALQITSTGSNDTITIRDGGIGTLVTTINDGNGHTITNTSKGVTSIQVTTPAKGDDKINYALTGALTTSETIKLSLGADNVQANLDFSKGVSAPSLKVQVQTGANSDQISTEFGAIKNTNVDFTTNLEGFNDQFVANLNGALTGTAKVLFDSNCGTGYNGVAIKMNGNIASTASFEADTTGGSVTNTIHVDYSGQLDGKLTIDSQGGPTYSFIESTVDLLAGSTGNVNAKVLGGDDTDLLVLKVYDYSHHLHSIASLLQGGKSDQAQGVATSNVKVVDVHLT